MKEYIATILAIALAIVIGVTAAGWISFVPADLILEGRSGAGTFNVFTGGVTTATSSVATSSGELVARNLDRQYLYLMNTDANDVWCNLGTTTATSSAGFKLSASDGDFYEIDSTNLYRGAITCISETAASVITSIEK